MGSSGTRPKVFFLLIFFGRKSKPRHCRERLWLTYNGKRPTLDGRYVISSRNTNLPTPLELSWRSKPEWKFVRRIFQFHCVVFVQGIGGIRVKRFYGVFGWQSWAKLNSWNIIFETKSIVKRRQQTQCKQIAVFGTATKKARKRWFSRYLGIQANHVYYWNSLYFLMTVYKQNHCTQDRKEGASMWKRVYWTIRLLL